jgi:spore coat polysaccharide biosynthesis protein SpsF
VRVDGAGPIAVLVQARMRSRRLPGKVLRPLAGRPLLAYVLERVRHARKPDRVIVCTTDEPADDAVESFCTEHGIECFRGQADNVAQRLLEAVDHYRLEAFVRICGDSPLLDPTLIDCAIGIYQSGRYEIVTNSLERTFPAGQAVELLAAAAFRRGVPRMRSPADLRRVTPYFYKHAERFSIFNFTAEDDLSGVRLVVDTAEDLHEVERLIGRMVRPHWEYGLRQIVADLHTLPA